MKLMLWVANDEPSGQDRILEVDRPYPCVPRQGDIVELVWTNSRVSGQVEKVTFDQLGRVTLHFTGSWLQVVSPHHQSWHELLDSNFETIPHERPPIKWGSTDHQPPIHLQEGNRLQDRSDIDVPTAPATEVPEGVEQEDEEPSPRTTN
jgi:hypothetical protein